MDRHLKKYKFMVTWGVPFCVSVLPSLREISVNKGCVAQVTFTKLTPRALVVRTAAVRHEQQLKGREPTLKQPTDIPKLQAVVRK